MQKIDHQANVTCSNRRPTSKVQQHDDTHQSQIDSNSGGRATSFRARAPWFFFPHLALTFSFTLIMLSTLMMVSRLQRLDNELDLDSLIPAKEISRRNIEISPNYLSSLSANTNGMHPSLPSPGNDEHSDVHQKGEDESNDFKLDFIMGGFPKTGSTSLLHLFQRHNETNVLEKEMCTFSSDEDVVTLSHLLDELPVKSKSMQRGIKCPVTLWNINGLSKLIKTKKDLKIVIGVRNPVSWFQSFYNYRVTEMHDKNDVVKPPPPNKLISPDTWRGVTTDGSRFDMALMQLGKVELGPNDLMLLGSHKRRLIPQSSVKIFLYSIDQLKDQDEGRSKLFHTDLQHFLGLEEDIEDIPVSNVNHFTRENRHPETINICSTRYNKLRAELIRNGKLSNRWIRSKFVDAADVTVGGKNHFLEIINGWEQDPCSGLHNVSSEEVQVVTKM